MPTLIPRKYKREQRKKCLVEPLLLPQPIFLIILISHLCPHSFHSFRLCRAYANNGVSLIRNTGSIQSTECPVTSDVHWFRDHFPKARRSPTECLALSPSRQFHCPLYSYFQTFWLDSSKVGPVCPKVMKSYFWPLSDEIAPMVVGRVLVSPLGFQNIASSRGFYKMLTQDTVAQWMSYEREAFILNALLCFLKHQGAYKQNTLWISKKSTNVRRKPQTKHGCTLC